MNGVTESCALPHNLRDLSLIVCAVCCFPELIGLLLPGVQSHLGSTDVAVRSRGMLVAQLLTKTVDPTGQQIEFEVSMVVFSFMSFEEKKKKEKKSEPRTIASILKQAAKA